MMPHATHVASNTRRFGGLSATHLPLAQRRDAIVTALAEANPGIAISVWEPRTSPAARGTARLRAYNGQFLQTMDTSSNPLPAAMSELYNEETVLPDEYMRDTVREASEQLCAVLEGMHEGHIAEAHGVSVQVSLIGRVQYVWLVVLALFDTNGVLLEWISAMTSLPAIFTPHLELRTVGHTEEVPHTPRESPDSRRASFSGSPPTPASTGSSSLYNRSQTPNVFVFAATPPTAACEWVQVRSDELKRKRRNQDLSDFRCAECGTTSTPQRRYASHARTHAQTCFRHAQPRTHLTTFLVSDCA